MNRRRAAPGFTLIEVVVATSLLALGLAIAFGTMRSAARATATAEASAQRQERLRAVQGFLRTQLSAALPIPYEFDGESGSATFMHVEQRKLQFVATMPGYLARGGPYLQTLELVSGADGQKLVFQHQLLSADGAAEAEREPVVLLEGIADASFEARSLDERARPGRWQDEWEVAGQLPPQLRLRLQFRDKSRRWPEFVVVTKLGAAFAAAAPVPLAGDADTTR